MKLDNYSAKFISGREPLAYKIKEDAVFVLVPYFYSDLQRSKLTAKPIKKPLKGVFKMTNPADHNANLVCALDAHYDDEISIETMFSQTGSGLDFPQIQGTEKIDLTDEKQKGPLKSRSFQDPWIEKNAKASDATVAPPLSVVQ